MHAHAIVNGGSYNTLQTPSNLKRQNSIKDLEDFARRAIAINRIKTTPVNIPIKRGALSFILLPITISSSNLLQRRRKSKDGSSTNFSSIDELESDLFHENYFLTLEKN